MNPYITSLQKQLLENETESAVEMLYESYCERNTPEPDTIKDNFAHLNDILGKLPLSEMDEVWYRICDLCIAYQKTAFMDGLRVGTKLTSELDGH